MRLIKLVFMGLAIVAYTGLSQTSLAAKDKPVAEEQLSCSKQARRVHKITDREKKREFIAKCQAERDAREKAEKEEQHRKKMAQKAKADAAVKAILNANP